ncbi:hypothetical protein OsJ_32523 [Oryza sativa Japonica Group]|uniref:Uncharacterized protein n=1 Tax=Oryza sativa subsp. japonica TaxID=39947 RepID=B9G740_ORYSJ|nr:hypothetical protein OsJ_32523 [Oryza sativa Japonica Group]
MLLPDELLLDQQLDQGVRLALDADELVAVMAGVAVDAVPGVALADGEGAYLGGEAAALAVGLEAVLQPAAHAVARAAPDAEPIEADAVLGVVGELAHLLHPLPDEVVHGGAVVGLRLHPEERVHGGQLVPQLRDLAADAAELPPYMQEVVAYACIDATQEQFAA